MGRVVGPAFGLGVMLAVLWLVLSGHFEPLLIVIGLVSVGGVVGLCLSLGIVDREGLPFHLLPRLIIYWSILALKIVRDNVIVAYTILRPKGRVKPGLVTISPELKTDLGRTIYANAITLTPGTYTVSIDQDCLLVHGLNEAAAQSDKSDEAWREVPEA